VQSTSANEAPRETSQLLSAMFASLYREGISRAQVARNLAIPRSELESLMFGLAMTAIEGKRSAEPNSAVHSRLSLVKGD
jgi:hypothetical protein